VLLDVIDIENARAFPAQEPLQPGFPLDRPSKIMVLAIKRDTFLAILVSFFWVPIVKTPLALLCLRRLR
jgi:hypothetical protein